MAIATALRQLLDYDYIISRLLSHDSYEMIAARETVRLNRVVTRSTIAGVARDIKAGSIKPTAARKQDDGWVKTYIYGVEPDNGGLPVFTGHMTLEGDYVVTNDWHEPFTDHKFAATVVPWAKYYGIKKMVIAGDLTDGNGQNKFKRKVKPTTLSFEFDMARKLLKYYAEWFDEIIFEPGNHDDWFIQNMDGDLMIGDYANLLKGNDLEGKLIVTPYDRLTVISGGEKWTIPHQADYSVLSLKVGDGLAQKFQSNVIVPHQHNSADGWDRYNRYRLIDSGGLFDVNLMAYVNLKTSTRPNPKQGFTVLKDGRGILITPDQRQTDWSQIQKETA